MRDCRSLVEAADGDDPEEPSGSKAETELTSLMMIRTVSLLNPHGNGAFEVR